jgi:hypothetical protein
LRGCPEVLAESFPQLVRGMVSGPVKIERQFNQRINSINLKPIRWRLRFVQYRPLCSESKKRRPPSQLLCDGGLRFDFIGMEPNCR